MEHVIGNQQRIIEEYLLRLCLTNRVFSLALATVAFVPLEPVIRSKSNIDVITIIYKKRKSAG